MPHLIPVQRPDKNGKLTIRWVRSDSTQPSQSLPTVPPAITSPDVNTLSAGDVPLLNNVFRNHSISSRGITVTNLTPRAARALEHILVETAEHSQMAHADAKFEISNALYEATNLLYPSIRKDTFIRVNNIAALFIVPRSARTASFQAKHYAQGLRDLPSERYRFVQDFMELPEDELKRARALCKVIDSIDKTHVISTTGEHDGRTNGYDGDHYAMLASDELAEYVLEHPDIVDDIIDIVNDRGITDVTAIRGFLEVEEPALRDGLL